jgi:hypothetical protein
VLVQGIPGRPTTNLTLEGGDRTLGTSEDNGSDKRNIIWDTYDTTSFWGLDLVGDVRRTPTDNSLAP